MTSQIFPLATDKLQLLSAAITFQESLVRIMKFTEKFRNNPDPMDPLLVKAFAISREVGSSAVLASLAKNASPGLQSTLENFDTTDSESLDHFHHNSVDCLSQLRLGLDSGLGDKTSGSNFGSPQPQHFTGDEVSSAKREANSETLNPVLESTYVGIETKHAKAENKQINLHASTDTKAANSDKDDASSDTVNEVLDFFLATKEDEAIYNEYKSVAIQDLMKHSFLPVIINEKEMSPTDFMYTVTINHTVYAEHRGTKKFAKTMAVIKACRNKEILSILPPSETKRWSSFYFRDIPVSSINEAVSSKIINQPDDSLAFSDTGLAKNSLYSLLGKRNIIPEYKYEEKNNMFYCQILIKGIVSGVGVGSSKKMAGEFAAKKVLLKLQENN